MPVVYTVSQIVSMMKLCLEQRFQSVDIEAEISNWRVYPSGHAYFVLKDEGAQLNAVLFSRVPCDCRAALADGRRVKVRGRISIYPQRGECQFVVMRIKIAGEGELMARYLELKAKLEAEGLFSASRKRPLPRFPRRIGLVTSLAGAVVHDMCRVLLRRFPNLEIRICPALVQGADAPPTLVSGVRYFSSCESWRADLIIVARGGGSFEDLFCFNDESLVREISACTIPVISAVGHETDFTLCDFAADVRAGTPSIAAELAVPVMADVVKRLADVCRSLVADVRSSVDMYAQHIDRLDGSLAALLCGAVQNASTRLDSLSRSLVSGMRGALSSAGARLDSVSARLPRAAKYDFERRCASVDKAAVRLDLLSPYSVLDRGYSLTTDESGVVMREIGALETGRHIFTRLKDGTVESIVSALGA